MPSGVYSITNKVNGKLYVGGAVCLSSRWNRHLHDLRRGQHHSGKLQHAWGKYGESAFEHRVILICAKEHVNYYEQRALEVLDAQARGYNILGHAGSSLGYRHTPETKHKLKALMLARAPTYGIPCSDEKKRKIGDANRGRVASEQTRKKLSIARQGKTPSKGMRHTEEAKARMSAMRKGVKRSPEAVAKTARTNTGRRCSDETKQKISTANKGRPRSRDAIEKQRTAMLAYWARKKSSNT